MIVISSPGGAGLGDGVGMVDGMGVALGKAGILTAGISRDKPSVIATALDVISTESPVKPEADADTVTVPALVVDLTDTLVTPHSTGNDVANI